MNMSKVKAVVQNGRAIIEQLEGYPNGTVLEFELLDHEDEDELDEEERAKLHASIDRGRAQAQAGQTRPAEELLARLRQG